MSIELTGVKKSYGKKEVLHGIDLSFGQGVYGLLGPNGAGKTTLMSIMTRLLEASAGDVKFSGMSITDKKSGYLKKLGFLPQYPGYYSNFTAWEFLEYMSVLKGIKGNNRKQIDSLLEFVNLTDAAWQKVGTFSGGMLRRVGLAQTLLGRAPECQRPVDDGLQGCDVHFVPLLALFHPGRAHGRTGSHRANPAQKSVVRDRRKPNRDHCHTHRFGYRVYRQ